MLTGVFKDKRNSRLGSPRTPELALRRLLQAKILRDVQFQAGAAVGPFVVDFVCHEKALVIELADAGVRQCPGSQTDAREQFLAGLGFRIMCFSRKEVLQLPDHVIAKIRHVLDETSSSNSVVSFPRAR